MDKKEMVFGTRAVMEAIKAGREIEKIYIQAGLNNDLIRELINTAQTHKVPFSFIPQQISDVRNFGAIARTLECAGLDGIIICEKGNAPISAYAMKTIAGALN